MKTKKQLPAIIATAFFFSMSGTAHAEDHSDNGINLPAPLNDSDFKSNGVDKIKLGQNLFYDKILSGNKNISCGTCHHALTASGDGLSVSIGEGGQGLGKKRTTGAGKNAIPERVPRNAQHLWNVQALEIHTMFHDGRVAVNKNQPSGFDTPIDGVYFLYEQNFPTGLDSVLAAQVLFPLASHREMAGQVGENSIANAKGAGYLLGSSGAWGQLASRLRAIPEYVEMFKAAYSDVNSASDITIVHIANAIAAFEGSAFKANNTPFDRYLRGDKLAMSESALRGMELFYDKANCSSCHSGSLMSDQKFHATAMPQTGPGRGSDFDAHGDFGREQVTLKAEDRYKFRTPTLRNVALNGPWGHSGAYNTLEAVVRHMLDPITSLKNYDPSQSVLPPRKDLDALDNLVMADTSRVKKIAAANEITPISLNGTEFKELMDFMNALTDPSSTDLRHTVPKKVPSGLPVDD